MKRLLFAVVALAVVTVGIACLPSDGQISYPPVSLSVANTWTGIQTFDNNLLLTYNGGSVSLTYPANTMECENIGNGTSFCDAIGIDSSHAGLWDFRQINSGGSTYFDSWISDASGSWTAHGGINPGQSTVSGLPAAASSAGQMRVVTDSTAVSAEGQTCVGSSTNKALAFSNGSVWKCF